MQQPKVDEQWDGRLVCQGSQGQILASAHVQGGAVHQDVAKNVTLNHAEAGAMARFYRRLSDKLAEQLASDKGTSPGTDGGGGPTGGQPGAGTVTPLEKTAAVGS